MKGLVPLAYALDDAELKQRAQKWVDWSLASQRDDGFYGPANNDDWWPRMVTNYFLRDHYEATGDPRVLPFLTRYYGTCSRRCPERAAARLGRARVGDEMDTALWLYNRTGDKSLLALVDLMRKQAYDWPRDLPRQRVHHLRARLPPEAQRERPAGQEDARGLVAAQRRRRRPRVDRPGRGELSRADHGTSLGIESGTEFLAGRSSGQGVEFCSIVEQMLSDETIVRILGDARLRRRA